MKRNRKEDNNKDKLLPTINSLWLANPVKPEMLWKTSNWTFQGCKPQKKGCLLASRPSLVLQSRNHQARNGAEGGESFHQDEGERGRNGQVKHRKKPFPSLFIIPINCQNKAKKETKRGIVQAQSKPYQIEKKVWRKENFLFRSTHGLRECIWRVRNGLAAPTINLPINTFQGLNQFSDPLEPAISFMLSSCLIKAATCPLARFQILSGLLIYNETWTIRTWSMYLSVTSCC